MRSHVALEPTKKRTKLIKRITITPDNTLEVTQPDIPLADLPRASKYVLDDFRNDRTFVNLDNSLDKTNFIYRGNRSMERRPVSKSTGKKNKIFDKDHKHNPDESYVGANASFTQEMTSGMRLGNSTQRPRQVQSSRVKELAETRAKWNFMTEKKKSPEETVEPGGFRNMEIEIWSYPVSMPEVCCKSNHEYKW